jgi:putative acyl-CoA dehydrogenase
VLDLARLANELAPRLVNFDRAGRRVDEVEFHPGLARADAPADRKRRPFAALGSDPRPGAQVARAGAYLLFGQVENGAQCPVTMTYASGAGAAPAPAASRARWLPKILSRDYDPRSLPVEQKRGALVGMGMTEKQGGTDVRANTTRATRMLPADAARASAKRARAPGASSATNGFSRRRSRMRT